MAEKLDCWVTSLVERLVWRLAEQMAALWVVAMGCLRALKMDDRLVEMLASVKAVRSALH